jgi:hypothetical protein
MPRVFVIVTGSRLSAAQEPVHHDLAAMIAVRGDLVPFRPATVRSHVEPLAARALCTSRFNCHESPSRCVKPPFYTVGVCRANADGTGARIPACR